MWRDPPPSLRLKWNHRVFGRHVKWMDCHPWHLPWKKKHGVSIKLIDGEAKLIGWTASWEICGWAWEFLIAASLYHLSHSHVWHCETFQIQVYIWPLALPCMQSSTLGKYTPCPALAAAHNPKDIFQNKWQHLQSNLRCPLQLVLLLKLPNANITIQVFSATLQVLLNMWKQLMYEWNQIRTQQFDGMARSQETARLKLCPSFEMPDNAKKEGKDFLVFFCCQIINYFCTRILVWSYFEILMRTRIVSTCTSKHSFMEAIKIVTVQSVVYILGKCVSAMRHIGMLFPLKIIFEVTMWVERNGSKHNSDVTAFLSCKECRDSKDDAMFHITNIGNTRGRTLKLQTRSLWSQYVIMHLRGSPHTTCSS